MSIRFSPLLKRKSPQEEFCRFKFFLLLLVSFFSWCFVAVAVDVDVDTHVVFACVNLPQALQTMRNSVFAEKTTSRAIQKALTAEFGPRRGPNFAHPCCSLYICEIRIKSIEHNKVVIGNPLMISYFNFFRLLSYHKIFNLFLMLRHPLWTTVCFTNVDLLAHHWPFQCHFFQTFLLLLMLFLLLLLLLLVASFFFGETWTANLFWLWS